MSATAGYSRDERGSVLQVYERAFEVLMDDGRRVTFGREELTTGEDHVRVGARVTLRIVNARQEIHVRAEG